MQRAIIPNRALLQTVLALEVNVIAIWEVKLKQPITAVDALVAAEEEIAITFETVFGVGADTASGVAAVDLDEQLAVADEAVGKYGRELLG
jgi:hypothetical protein